MPSLADLVLDWQRGVQAVARGDWDCALRLFSGVPGPPAKMCFNVGCVHLLAGDPEAALRAFDQAVARDAYLAVGFFQRGVANLQLERFQEALSDFRLALARLRGNTAIDYTQLGLRFRLQAWEVLFNVAAAQCRLGLWAEAARSLEEAISREGARSDLSAALAHVQGQGPLRPRSVPRGEVFRPPRRHLEQLRPVDFLGKAKVVVASGIRPQQPQAPDEGAGARPRAAPGRKRRFRSTRVPLPSRLRGGTVAPPCRLEPAKALGPMTPAPVEPAPPSALEAPPDAAMEVGPGPRASPPDGEPLSEQARGEGLGPRYRENCPPQAERGDRWPQPGTTGSQEGARRLAPPWVRVVLVAPPKCSPSGARASGTSALSPLAGQLAARGPDPGPSEDPVDAGGVAVGDPTCPAAVTVHCAFTLALEAPRGAGLSSLRDLLSQALPAQAWCGQLSYREPGDTGRWVPLAEEAALQRAWRGAASGPAGLQLRCRAVGGRPVRAQAVAQLGDAARRPEDSDPPPGDTVDVLVDRAWPEGPCDGRVGIFPECLVGPAGRRV
ncbi:NADPH oxidase activator 1 [Pteronotus mesoamericanus]|uniref:NADPH oxidase activator 1 n=1 Tax=Pteronotus mesoamericanus TaxID=1884717 RepID=UPI0023EE00AA|nr:NADPH oxidase activator 1 [Pteronotus parnellii mesoamericanus]